VLDGLEGFLSDGGMVLVHDEALFGLVDQWVSGLSADHFIQTLPLGRRAFSTFPPMMRRQIGEQVRQGGGLATAAGTITAGLDDWDMTRVEPLISVLRLILGLGLEQPPGLDPG